MNVTDSKRCRILYITAIARTQLSFLRGQNAFIARAGFELHAIATPDATLDELRLRDDVCVHPVNIRRRISPLADIVSLIHIWWVLRRVKPDILHLSTPKAALLGAIAGSLAGVPIRIFLVRGLMTTNSRGIRRRIYRYFEVLTSRLCHRTLFVSPSNQSAAIAEGIVRDDASHAVLANGMSNGIDVERYRPSCKQKLGSTGLANRACDPVIGFVGRLTHDKGIEELVSAWKQVRNEFGSTKLLLVGDWEIDDAVAAETRELLIQSPDVEITGYVSDVRPFYEQMTVFAFPSHREGFPNAPMEAAAMELPVVAYRVVGSVDAVQDGVTGTLVPPRDPNALAVAIRNYLHNEELRQQHGKAGRERVLHYFRPETIWEAMYQEYVRLLRRRGIPIPESMQVVEGAELLAA